MGSNSIPGLTVVLTACTRANLRDGKDRTRLGDPSCMPEHRKGDFSYACHNTNSYNIFPAEDPTDGNVAFV